MRQRLSQYFLTAHEPADPVCVVRHHHDDAAPTVVLLTGLALSMSEPRYLWSILARRLRARGLNVVQYDHPGHADSAATGRPATWPGVRHAARAVVAHARATGAGPVSVIGCGLGNVLAAELLTTGEAASGLLVCPDLALWRTGTDAAPGELAALAARGRAAPDELQDSFVAAALLDAAVGSPTSRRNPRDRSTPHSSRRRLPRRGPPLRPCPAPAPWSSRPPPRTSSGPAPPVCRCGRSSTGRTSGPRAGTGNTSRARR